MRKIIFNKKFLAIVGICLSVAGGFAIKQKITTKLLITVLKSME